MAIKVVHYITLGEFLKLGLPVLHQTHFTECVHVQDCAAIVIGGLECSAHLQD